MVGLEAAAVPALVPLLVLAAVAMAWLPMQAQAWPLVPELSEASRDASVASEVGLLMSRVKRQSAVPPIQVLTLSELLPSGSPIVSVANTLLGIFYAFRNDADSPAPAELSINSVTGLVSLQANQRLDYDVVAKRTLPFIVRVWNSSSNVGEVIYRIDVQPANDEPPIIQRPFDGNLPRVFRACLYQQGATKAGSIVRPEGVMSRFTATDADSDARLSFALAPGTEALAEGRFRIVSDLGYLVTVGNDAFISGKTYQLAVQVQDSNANRTTSLGWRNRYGYAPIIVSVDYQNPELASNPVVLSFPETTLAGQQAAVVRCASLNNIWSTVRLTSSNSGGLPFTLAESGVITLTTAQDYDLPSKEKQWRFDVTCTENGTRSTSAEVIVNLLDVNDNRPYFDLDYYLPISSVGEDAALNDTILAISPIDPDTWPNKQFKYTLSGPQSSFFYVETENATQNASIKLLKQMDYELLDPKLRQYEFTISVTDGFGPAPRQTASVVIPVANRNDEAPTLLSGQATLSKTAAVGTIAYQMLGQDADNSDITYYFWNGAALVTDYPFIGAALFRVDTNTGFVTVASSLAAVTTFVYNVSIVAQDSGTCPGGCPPVGLQLKSQVATLMIYISDANQYAPAFRNCPASPVSFPEAQATGTTVSVDLTATDADTGVNGRVVYSLFNNDIFPLATAFFTIDPNSAALKSGGLTLDREEIRMYNPNAIWLTVVAADLGTPSLTAMCTFQITLTDVNDNRPEFDNTEHTRVIRWDAPVRSEVIRIFAYDPDSGVNADVQYQLLNTSTYFRIDKDPGTQEGVISLVAQYLTGAPPPDSPTEVQLIVEASNTQPLTTPGVSWSRAVIRVLLTSNNDFLPPLIGRTPSTYQVTISETSNTATSIVNMTAALQSAFPPKFSWTFIYGSKGPITNPSSSQNFRFVDYNPTTQSSKGVSGGTDNGYQYETTPYILLHMRCLSNVVSTKIGDIYLDIRLNVSMTDTNNRVPAFFAPDAYKSAIFPETFNQTPSTNILVTRVSALDMDSVLAYRNVTYSLSPVNDYTKFTIDPITGTVYTQSGLVFDRETLSNPYAITVEASDQSPSALVGIFPNPNKALQNIRISLADINDNPPVFNASSFSIAGIPEDSPLGRVITQITATDADLNPVIQYQIVSGNTGNAFRVNFSTGEVYIARQLDYDEGPTSYTLGYVAFDGLFRTTATVTVAVSNVVDYRPVFGSTYVIQMSNISETTAAGPFYFATPSKLDAGSSLVYSVAGALTQAGSSPQFTINPSTALLSFAGSVNRVNFLPGLDRFRFNVLADDRSSLRGYTIFELYPSDVNDNAPIFLTAALNLNLVENTSTSVVFATLKAYDPDRDALTYGTLLPASGSQEAPEYVSLAPNGDLRATLVFDYEALPAKVINGRFQFRAYVFDGLRNVTGTVTVRILDAPDSSPTFVAQQPSSFNVSEAISVNDTAVVILAQDLDTADSGRLQCSLLPGSSAYFQVLNLPDIDGCAVIVASQLDYDAPGAVLSHTVIIQVTDGKTTPATKSFTLLVTEANDNDPVFAPSTLSTGLLENVATNTVITALSVTDADPVDKSFTILVDPTSDPYNNLQIKQLSGSSAQVLVWQPLDREIWNPDSASDAVVQYRLLALDGRGRTGTATITLTIQDVNDSPPRLQDAYALTALDSAAAGTVLLPSQMFVTDPDKNSATLAYRFQPGGEAAWGSFQLGQGIVSGSGLAFFSLATKATLSRDSSPYLLSLTITDPTGGPTGTATVTVTVVPSGGPTALTATSDVVIYYNATEYKTGDSIDLGPPRIIANDAVTWDRRTYRWDNPSDTSDFFNLTSDGKRILLKSGTATANYTVTATVTDPSGASAVSTETVRVYAVSRDAIDGATSLVVDGLSAADFVQSALQATRTALAAQLGTLADKVLPVSVTDVVWSPGRKASVAFFVASGSPFYTRAKMDFAMRAALPGLNTTLSPLGGKIAEAPYTPCRRFAGCPGGCSHRLAVNSSTWPPLATRTNTSSLVSVNVTKTPVCSACSSDATTADTASVAPVGCTPESCLNNGTCVPQLFTNTYQCQCLAGFDGPRCQRLQVGFDQVAGYILVDPLDSSCRTLNLSFSFITTSADGILLYTGPYGVAATPVPAQRDFLSIHLVGGRLRALIDLGSGPIEVAIPAPSGGGGRLDDSRWHRVDLTLSPTLGSTQVTLLLDRCQNLDYSGSVNGGTSPDLSTCATTTTVPGLGLDTWDWPMQLGGRMDATSGSQYPTGLPTQGVVGQLAQLRVGTRLVDLVADSRTVHSGAKWLSSLVALSCTDDKCGPNGFCWGAVGAAAVPAQCDCRVGWVRNTTNGPCSLQAQPIQFAASSYMWWSLKPAFLSSVTKQATCISVQFRSRQPSGVLLRVQGSDPYRPAELVLRLRDSRLVAQMNIGDYVLREATLRNGNVSDGGLHSVRVCRSLQLAMEIFLDSGEGINYAMLWGSFNYNYNFIDVGPSVIGGASITVDSTGAVSVAPPEDNLQLSCLAAPQVNLAVLPNSGDAAESVVTSSANAVTVAQCTDPKVTACPANTACPGKQVCLGILQPSGSALCGCLTGWTLRNNLCYASPCFPINPCQNGGYCIPSAGGTSSTCRCRPGYTGDVCERLVLVFGAASAGIIVAIVLGILVLVIVLALLVWFCCFRRRGEPLLEPDKDTRENVVAYDEDGAGEEDTRNFDLQLLRVPNGAPPPPVKVVEPPLVSVVQPMSRAAPTPSLQPPLDAPDGPVDALEYTLDYGYEGQGSEVGDLSSVCSGDSDRSQDYGELHRWGPDFRPVADLYAQPGQK